VNLKLWLVKNNIPQGVFADRIGVSRSHICQIIRGKGCTFQLAKKICLATNCEVDWWTMRVAVKRELDEIKKFEMQVGKKINKIKLKQIDAFQE